MISIEKIQEQHDHRLKRAGSVLWCQMMLHFELKHEMSGEFAVKLMDTYGCRYQDIMFMCATHGINIDQNSFHAHLCKREEEQKKSVKCSEQD